MRSWLPDYPFLDQINHGVMRERLENKKPDGENSSHRQANVSKLGR